MWMHLPPQGSLLLTSQTETSGVAGLVEEDVCGWFSVKIYIIRCLTKEYSKYFVHSMKSSLGLYILYLMFPITMYI